MIVALLIICMIFGILYIFAQAHNEDLQYGIYLCESLRHLDKLKQRLEADRVNRSQNFF